MGGDFVCIQFFFLDGPRGGGGTGNWFLSRETRSDIKFFIGSRDLFRAGTGTGTEPRRTN